MKFVLETGNSILVHAYDTDYISLAGIQPGSPVIDEILDEWNQDDRLGIMRKSFLLNSTEGLESWKPQNLTELKPDDFLPLSENSPEVLLIGTGKHLQFPAADSLAVLQQQNLGYEIMDTTAACRTYNVLVNEGRNVTLAVMMITD